MPNLLIKNVGPEIVNALERRAARHGRSIEAEHREILTQTLLGPRRKSFAEVLASIPNLGTGEDFERIN